MNTMTIQSENKIMKSPLETLEEEARKILDDFAIVPGCDGEKEEGTR